MDGHRYWQRNENCIGIAKTGEPVYCEFRGPDFQSEQVSVMVADFHGHKLAGLAGRFEVSDFDGSRDYRGSRIEGRHGGQRFWCVIRGAESVVEINPDPIVSQQWDLYWNADYLDKAHCQLGP